MKAAIMKSKTIGRACPIWVWLMSVLAGATGTATLWSQTVTQSIELRPGWNAVWLEVEPVPNRISESLADLPVASVWTRGEQVSVVDFIQDPSEQAFNEAGWRGWYHPSRPESFLGNLFTLQANRAYLVKLDQETPVTWTLTGRPSLDQPAWVTDSFNLRGFPVSETAPPTFGEFLGDSRAHAGALGERLQPVYRLADGAGQWVAVDPDDEIEAGQAYWVRVQGASDFVAPLEVRSEIGDGLDFGLQLVEMDLHLRNVSERSMSAYVQDMVDGVQGPVAYYSFAPQEGGDWVDLPDPLIVPLEAGEERRLRVAVRRQEVVGSQHATVLEVWSDHGSRQLVPVRAERIGGGDGGHPLAGLWAGSVRLDRVSEAHAANPNIPTATKSPFTMRLLVHVDRAGVVRLLKEVVQMWRDGTVVENGEGDLITDQPGEYVLLTEDSLIPFFQGSVLRDGVRVGRRISSVGFDFPTSPGTNYLALAGGLDQGNFAFGAWTLPHDHPLNPFVHKYHPDHDNLNSRFDGPLREAYDLTRTISLIPESEVPEEAPIPDYGYERLGGIYTESIKGLHKHTINVSGRFTLDRVSFIDELNPSPNP